MENLGDISPLFCTPTWPSNHVSGKQEFGCAFSMVNHAKLVFKRPSIIQVLSLFLSFAGL